MLYRHTAHLNNGDFKSHGSDGVQGCAQKGLKEAGPTLSNHTQDPLKIILESQHLEESLYDSAASTEINWMIKSY